MYAYPVTVRNIAKSIEALSCGERLAVLIDADNTSPTAVVGLLAEFAVS